MRYSLPKSLLTPAVAATLSLVFGGVLAHELRSPEEERGRLLSSTPEVAAVSPAVLTPAAPRVPKAEMTRTEMALSRLQGQVVEQSHPSALRLAFQAYFNFKEEHPEAVRKPYLYFVDYGLDNRTPRGYVFDMEKLSVVDGPFMVSHGRGSGADGVPKRFSNRNGSAATSLGLYLTQETYNFSGKSSGRFYRSVGLRLKGLSGEYNGAARERGVVVHGAPYVTASRAGRSEGCPAMEQHRARRLIPLISNGALVFQFSPLDTEWMEEDRWAAKAAGAGRLAQRG